MKLLLRIVFVFLAVFSFNAFAIEVVSSEFGIFDASDPQRVVFVQAQSVPLREGQRYGWMIELRDVKQHSVSVREEYVLPGNAAIQRSEATDGSAKILIPLDRRNQISQRQLVPVDGRIYGEWTVGPHEPAGPRQLDVIVEGQIAASFRFEVK